MGLSWIDCLVFSAVIIISIAIGIYHSHWRKKPLSVRNDFFTADGQLGPIPVGISLLASYLSSITLIGQTAEVHQFGPSNWIFGFAGICLIYPIGYVFIPFFRQRNYCSAYQYLGERFSRSLQIIASLIITVQTLFFMAAVLYAPAIAIYHVTGVSPYVVATLMYGACTLYTTIGGIKAVIWTDTFQVIVLFGSLITILTIGTLEVGGLTVIWERNEAFNRTQFFNFTFDPTKRYTFWSSFLGAGFLHLGTYGGNQLQIQRYLTVKSNEEAIKMLWVNGIGWTSVTLLTTFMGMLIFASYANCDPIKSGQISRSDELFPFYMSDVLSSYYGLSGLFLSGIFSAALSTVSTGINSITAIWYSEICEAQLLPQLHSSPNFVRVLGVVVGLLSYSLVYLIPHLGAFVQITVTLSSICASSIFGTFVLGIFTSRANTKGTTCGLLISILFLVWLSCNSIMMQSSGRLLDNPLPTSVQGCLNDTIKLDDKTATEMAPWIYRISFLWYSPIAMLLSTTIGYLVSLVCGKPSEAQQEEIGKADYFELPQKPADIDAKLSEANGIH